MLLAPKPPTKHCSLHYSKTLYYRKFMILEVKNAAFRIEVCCISSHLLQHSWVVCLLRHFSLSGKFSLIRTILFPNKMLRVCVCTQESLGRISFAMQRILDEVIYFKPPRRLTSLCKFVLLQSRSMAAKSSPACLPSSTLTGFRLQTKSLLWKHRKSPNNRGSEWCWRNASNLELVIRISCTSYLCMQSTQSNADSMQHYHVTRERNRHVKEKIRLSVPLHLTTIMLHK